MLERFDLVEKMEPFARCLKCNTPVAAVLFTLEEIIGDLNAPLLGSAVLSSVTSVIVARSILGDEPLFHVPEYELLHSS